MASYIGKDVIHYGCGLVLDPSEAWAKLSHSSRKNVNKARREGVIVTRVEGTAEEQLRALRSIWYLPADPNFPAKLAKGESLHLAHLEGELVGGMILIPVGRHLFLNNLAANAKGKECQAQGF